MDKLNRFTVYCKLNPHLDRLRKLSWYYRHRGKISLSYQKPKSITEEEAVLKDIKVRSKVNSVSEGWQEVFEEYVNQWERK